MKKYLLLLFIILLLPISESWAQCTPVDCSASLPAYGGLCDQFLAQGTVNTPYSDSESFILTDNCFDAGLFDPALAGNNIRITTVDNFTFSGFPNGITASPNQNSYSPPTGSYIAGCAAFSGTPTQAGIFEANIDFLADVILCNFGIPLNDNDVGFPIEITILPDASFSGLSATYCDNDPLVTLTPTGTTGGTFSGTGVSGNTFDPAIAGVGTHTITYSVTAQEGTAIASATNSSNFTVIVNAITTYYADTDGDNFGDPNNSMMLCEAITGYVLDNTDCDDTNNAIHPDAVDIPLNNIDEDCSGADETMVVDMDMDGFDNSVDCNDNNPDVNPDAIEICDGKDNDCDGWIDNGLMEFIYYADSDEDNHGDPNNTISVCDATPPMGYVSSNDDCDDTNPDTFSGAAEVCDGLDNNCDGTIDEGIPTNTFYADVDQDTYGDLNNTVTTCYPFPPAGYIGDSSDCDDNDSSINLGAIEICDGIDNNCDGNIDEGITQITYYADTDMDGFGDPNNSFSTCQTTVPDGYVENNSDCDDTNGDTYLGATEVCDGMDNDCNGTIDDGLDTFTYYADSDTDNFGDINTPITTCENTPPDGYVADNTDCNDTDPDINPMATEIPDNGIDEDCTGGDLVDILEIAALGIHIYPNPTQKMLQLQFPHEMDATITIFNTKGQVIGQQNDKFNPNSILDISHLDNGLYVLKITDLEGNIGSFRFVVSR